MGVLFTTGRNPCAESRELSRALASVVPGSISEARGKKAIEDVVSRARLLGKRRIAIISSENERVSEINFAAVRGSSWEWLGSPVKIGRADAGSTPVNPPCCMEFSGARAKIWRELLEGEECGAACDCEPKCPGVVANCGEGKLSFEMNGTRIGPELVFA